MEMKGNKMSETGHAYTPEELKRMQNIGLEMLIEVDRICRKHGIIYEIDGGTLLGAVRNKKFIPWDDDVDIRMMQDEYEKLREVCKTELDQERFFFQDCETDPGYRFGYGKIVRKGTTFYRVGQDMLTMKRGVFLDIFNCVGMPQNPILKKKFNISCFIARKIGYSPIGAANEKNPFYRCLYRLLSKIPMESLRKKYHKLNHKYDKVKTKYVRTPGWHYTQEDDGYLRRWMDETCELEFEGHMFIAPKDYDGYLRQLYGDDYMTPPPKEKQVPEIMASKFDLGDCGL